MASFPNVFQSTSLANVTILLYNSFSKMIETISIVETMRLNRYVPSSPILLTYRPKEYRLAA